MKLCEKYQLCINGLVEQIIGTHAMNAETARNSGKVIGRYINAYLTVIQTVWLLIGKFHS